MNSTTGNLLIEDLDFVEKIFNASRMIIVHAEHKKVEETVKIAKRHHTIFFFQQ